MPANFQRSADTSLLVTLFSRAEHGELVTYEQLEGMLGRDPRLHRAAIHSALRIVQNETGKVFECEAKLGYRCLDDAQIVGSTQSIRERQHRLTRKALKRLGVVRTDKLPDDKRTEYYTALSIQGAMHHVTTAKAQAAIASKVNGSTQQLAVAMTLKALSE